MLPYTACPHTGCGASVISEIQTATTAAMEICFAISTCLRMCSPTKSAGRVSVRIKPRGSHKVSEKGQCIAALFRTMADSTRHERTNFLAEFPHTACVAKILVGNLCCQDVNA